MLGIGYYNSLTILQQKLKAKLGISTGHRVDLISSGYNACNRRENHSPDRPTRAHWRKSVYVSNFSIAVHVDYTNFSINHIHDTAAEVVQALLPFRKTFGTVTCYWPVGLPVFVQLQSQSAPDQRLPEIWWNINEISSCLGAT